MYKDKYNTKMKNKERDEVEITSILNISVSRIFILNVAEWRITLAKNLLFNTNQK
jgi:hypothetical protein